ncbi:MAG TPA: PH domain-containing protein, partial [Candidatus Saccharimonadaceae bacterium]|nr:PH domain-containing protein [Candidatus Saccharimonadaceae bacterium]
MSDRKELEARLKEIGCNFRFWGRAELRELANVLLPDEIVEICVNGQYEGGFAMLVATDQRVLLIDKKPMYLTLEDIRFDMIAEVDYNHRMLNAAVFICTPNKSLRFIAYNHVRLRKLFTFVQQRVMEIRQHYQQQSQVWR